MKRHAFKMKLKPGIAAEYKKRHDEIWPELRAAGVSDYSIFFDEATNILFAVQKLADKKLIHYGEAHMHETTLRTSRVVSCVSCRVRHYFAAKEPTLMGYTDEGSREGKETWRGVELNKKNTSPFPVNEQHHHTNALQHLSIVKASEN
jgi:L-rhamnose mutarotase